MNKEQFYEEQKAEIKEKYSALRKTKMKRQEALEKLAEEYNYSTSTIGEIMNNTNYRKSSKKRKEKTVPISE